MGKTLLVPKDRFSIRLKITKTVKNLCVNPEGWSKKFDPEATPKENHRENALESILNLLPAKL